MSAHPPHKTEDSKSIWKLLNTLIAIAVGGFAFFWGTAMLTGSYGISSSKEDAAKDSSAPPAAEAPAAPAPAAPAPAAPAATATAAPAPAPAPTPAPAAAPASAGAEVAEVIIKPDLTNPLAYDKKEFTVKAGQKVKLTFNNTHPAVPQPHNIVISKPSTKDKLLGLAMQMAAAPDGMAKGFIPDSPDILFNTKLLQPNTSETIEFTAPAAGEYPYICTFPGHGAIMNGVMKVQ